MESPTRQVRQNMGCICEWHLKWRAWPGNGWPKPVRHLFPFMCLQAVLLTALSFALGVLVCYTAQQRAPGGGGRGLFGFGAPDRFHQTTCPPPPQPGTKRRNVVFAAVGESWTPDK